MKFRAIFAILILLTTLSCVGMIGTKQLSTKPVEQSANPKEYSYIVKATYPHSTDSYTQGLQYIDGELWEGTGLNGHSRIMRVDMASGKGELFAQIGSEHFGEGITILGDSLYYLTWQSGVAMLYNRSSGDKINEFRYTGEGWGLTSDGQMLYMSNGSSKIALRDPKDFSVKREFNVTLNGTTLNLLNELEWIEGKIWANVYTTNYIVIIDPTSGVVEGIINLENILPKEEITQQTDVLNGIAYDDKAKRIFVTGKNWSKLFEIEIIEIKN
ncbi:MAG: glutaminyl-peptide cyclotransferase [Rikenellaceae bacterium]